MMTSNHNQHPDRDGDSGQQSRENDSRGAPRRQRGVGGQSTESRQQAEKKDQVRRQGGWSRDEDGMSHEPGRKPPAERDRDYDPDGDRTGRR
jgi:hypothetical protein